MNYKERVKYQVGLPYRATMYRDALSPNTYIILYEKKANYDQFIQIL